MSVNPILYRDDKKHIMYEIYLRDSLGKHTLPSTITWGLGTPKPVLIIWQMTVVTTLDGQELQVDKKKDEINKKLKDWNFKCVTARCFSIHDMLSNFMENMKRNEEQMSSQAKHYENLLDMERKWNEKERLNYEKREEKMSSRFNARVEKMTKKFIDLGVNIEDLVADRVVELVANNNAELSDEELSMEEGKEGSESEDTE